MIVDSDVKILPAGVMCATSAPVRTDLDVRETSQLLNIEVEQIARDLMLVAYDGRHGLQIAPTVEAKTTKNTAHGSAAATSGLGNMHSRQALTAKLLHLLNNRISSSAG